MKVQHHGYTVIPTEAGCICGMPDENGDIGEGGDCRSIGCDPCCTFCSVDDGDCPDAATCAGWGKRSTITAAEIRDAIAAILPECPVTVEQTGGGTATMYVGTYPGDKPDGDRGRFWLAIGPGSYDWTEPWQSSFHWSEVCIGPDDDGESDAFAYVETIAELVEYVRSAER